MPMDIAICIVIFVLIPCYLVYRFGRRKKRKLKKRRKHLRRMMEKCSNEIKVSELMKAYKENEITAYQKYLGKIVCISGSIIRITRIESEYTPDTPPVMFISQSYASVLCQMYKNDEEPLRYLKKGDKITVYGLVSEFSINVGDKQGSVLLTSCVIPPDD